MSIPLNLTNSLWFINDIVPYNVHSNLKDLAKLYFNHHELVDIAVFEISTG